MQLTKNFSLAELTRSQKAAALKIDNTPNAEQTANLKALAENILQPLRDACGFPINITSGLRVLALNRAVGGSSTSQHTRGEAVDINVPGRNKVIFDYIVNNLNYDQIIWEFGSSQEPDWVHVSYKRTGANRKQKLKAVKVNGKTQYLPI